MERDPVLIVFAKAPRAGFVKTRLAVDLGPEKALEVYRRMSGRLWTAWREAQAQGAFKLWLCFDPPEAEPEVRSWLPGAGRYLPQVSGNLGRRLSNALASALSGGGRKVALVGTDAPDAVPARVMEAFSELESGSVVLGPSLDGGFYLMAISGPIMGMEDLMEQVPWSSSGTLAALTGRLRTLGLEIKLLPEARDIDTLHDLEAYRENPLWMNCSL